FFFFSSRRRHTRCYRDWSSDVCSSDLGSDRSCAFRYKQERQWTASSVVWPAYSFAECFYFLLEKAIFRFNERCALIRGDRISARSEERRVGRECKSGVGR